MTINKNTMHALTGLLVSLCVASASVSAQHAKPVKIFLLGGQSNMAGQLKEYWADVQSPYKDPLPQIQRWQNKRNQWAPLAPTHRLGPEIAFGHVIAKALPNDDVRLVKYAINGTALYDDWAPTTGPCYIGFMAAAQGALADLEAMQVPYEIAGMLWLQGESDAVETMGSAYEQNLAAFIVHMRSEFNTPEMPFIIARVRDFYGKGAQAKMVRDAQQALAETMPQVAWFDTDDCGTLINGGHYALPGTIEIGNRFAQSYMEIVSETKKPWWAFWR
jgi:hypothetical protein